MEVARRGRTANPRPRADSRVTKHHFHLLTRRKKEKKKKKGPGDKGSRTTSFGGARRREMSIGKNGSWGPASQPATAYAFQRRKYARGDMADEPEQSRFSSRFQAVSRPFPGCSQAVFKFSFPNGHCPARLEMLGPQRSQHCASGFWDNGPAVGRRAGRGSGKGIDRDAFGKEVVRFLCLRQDHKPRATEIAPGRRSW